jgi:hypothetical protein
MKKAVCVFLSYLMLLTGCVVTRISSVTIPDHASYGRMLVFADYEDIETRSSVEDEIIYYLKKNDITGIKSINVFSPLKDYSDSAIEIIKLQQGYDGIVRIVPNGGNTTRRGSAYNNWWGGVSTSSREEVSGIYTKVYLVDSKSQEKVYQASVKTTLGEYANNDAAINSFADKIVTDLAHKGFLKGIEGRKYNSSGEEDAEKSTFSIIPFLAVCAAFALIAVVLKTQTKS